MDLETLRKQHSDKTRLLRAIITVAQEEKRELTSDEEDKFASLKNELTDLQRWIEKMGVVEGNEQVASRSIHPATRPGVGEEDQPQYGLAKTFRSFGEQLQAIAHAAVRPNDMDRRLHEQRAVSGMSEGVPADGGFLVQTDFSAELLRRAYETGQVASRCRRIPISSNANGLKINGINETSRANGSRWGGVKVYWTAEAGDKTDTLPKFRQIELNLKKLTGLAYATDELLQDAGALEQIIMQAFSEEFGFRLDDAIINGAGGGMPQGILGSTALVTVAIEGGQLADTILPENLVKMWSRCYNRSRLNAVWFINQDIEPQLFTMGLQVGLGGVSVYMPPGGLSGQPYGSLFGRPVIAIEQAATLGDVGDIILADMSQYVLIDKGGVQSASSIHVRFVNDESVFRFTYRVDGQPLWAAPLIPFTGAANTVGPFVTLAAR